MTSGSISRLFGQSRATDRIIAVTHGRQIDLVQFHRDVAANAIRLQQMGCNRALLACTDTYWAAVGLLALFHAGASVVMPQNMRPDSLATIEDRWDCVVCDTPLWPDHQALCLIASEVNAPSLPSLDPDACYLDIFTSGSTGRPKRVPKTLSLLEQEAEAVERLFGSRLGASSHVHATVSHQHLYGLTFGLIWPLYAGRPFHGRTHEIWETVLATKLGGSVLVTSPAHLTRLSGFSPLPATKRPALILSAGSPLPSAAAQEASQILGTAPTEIFGSTETGAIAWRSWMEPAPAWHPLPGVDVQRLADGRMSVASPFIAGGNPRYTGADLIVLREDGSFEALGRADDIVKVEGKRVSLMEIEAELQHSPSSPMLPSRS
ncbi:MAG: AMP-binding protein [Dongiaceae bacterium]